MNVEELFGSAGLASAGKLNWKQKKSGLIGHGLNEPGVYAVVMANECEAFPLYDRRFDKSIHPDFERMLWIPDETVLYVGQTTGQTLKRRIKQFLDHQYGARGPHKGGQSVHLLDCDLEVIWSPADSPKLAEAKMLLSFMKEHAGRLPYANRDFPTRKALLSCLES